jgi:hypothetical protein
MIKVVLVLLSIGLASQVQAQEENSMDDDDKIRIVFSYLQGTLSYTGNSESVLSETNGFMGNDLDLIRRSANDKSYVKDSMDKLVEACNYYEQTSREDLSISYLIESGYRSHDLELENQKQFRRDLYDQLSPNAKATFDKKFDSAHLNASTSRSNSIRANPDVLMSDKDTQIFLENFARSCVNVRKVLARMEGNNWIEEPQLTTMEYKGAEK